MGSRKKASHQAKEAQQIHSDIYSDHIPQTDHSPSNNATAERVEEEAKPENPSPIQEKEDSTSDGTSEKLRSADKC